MPSAESGGQVGLELVEHARRRWVLGEPVERVLAVHQVESRFSGLDAFDEGPPGAPIPVLPASLGRRSQGSGNTSAEKLCCGGEPETTTVAFGEHTETSQGTEDAVERVGVARGECRQLRHRQWPLAEVICDLQFRRDVKQLRQLKAVDHTADQLVGALGCGSACRLPSRSGLRCSGHHLNVHGCSEHGSSESTFRDEAPTRDWFRHQSLDPSQAEPESLSLSERILYTPRLPARARFLQASFGARRKSRSILIFDLRPAMETRNPRHTSASHTETA